MKIDKNTTLKIAKLCRIRIKEHEIKELSVQLSSILDWVEQLNEVDTEDIAPMASVHDVVLKWRRDVVDDGEKQDEIVRNAPDSQGGFFTVPKVIE